MGSQARPGHLPGIFLGQGTTHDGSAPLVVGPQEGTYSIHLGGGMGAVQAHMCPLTPCITPTPHVPRRRQTLGARPLSWVPKRGGGGAVRAHMFPLTPCITPMHHVPRTRQTKGARPLSLHYVTHNYALPSLGLPLPLPLPRPFLGGGNGADTGLSS